MSLNDFYYTHTHPLILPLLHMSWRGVLIDQTKRQEATQEYRTRETTLTQDLQTLVGKPLDPHSPKQLMEYVYTDHHITPIVRYRKRTTGEKVSTNTLDEPAIVELLTRPLPLHVKQVLRTILSIRETHKVLATYLEAPLDADGRLRCGYSLTGTETGRISSHQTPMSTGTNLQNVPRGIIREMVIADPGTTFLYGDLSQAEARVVAYQAQEEGLIRVFESGGDIHRRNASKIFRVPEEAVTYDQRQLAKTIVHASNYGMGPIKFAQEAGVSKVEATRLLNAYFNAYPGLKRWHLEVADTLKRTRVLTSPLGRRRQFFGRWGDDLLRTAYSFVPQSTVADLLNDGLIQYDCERPNELLLQVHDAVIAQVPDAQVPVAQETLRQCLTRSLTIHGRMCTIPVTLKTGRSWAALD